MRNLINYHRKGRTEGKEEVKENYFMRGRVSQAKTDIDKISILYDNPFNEKTESEQHKAAKKMKDLIIANLTNDYSITMKYKNPFIKENL